MPVRSRSLPPYRMNGNPGWLHIDSPGGIRHEACAELWFCGRLWSSRSLPLPAKAQSLTDSADSSGTVASTTPAQPDLTYTRPTEKTKIQNYVFDAFGPYPIAGAAVAAGISQTDNTPPEWKQGAAGYGKRFGSDFGIAAISTTTRYAMAEALKEDTLYYRCECKGVFPRLSHAMISTLTARRGEDGHRVFSFSAAVAPYAGTMTAVYALVSRSL